MIYLTDVIMKFHESIELCEVKKKKYVSLYLCHKHVVLFFNVEGRKQSFLGDVFSLVIFCFSHILFSSCHSTPAPSVQFGSSFSLCFLPFYRLLKFVVLSLFLSGHLPTYFCFYLHFQICSILGLNKKVFVSVTSSIVHSWESGSPCLQNSLEVFLASLRVCIQSFLSLQIHAYWIVIICLFGSFLLS